MVFIIISLVFEIYRSYADKDVMFESYQSIPPVLKEDKFRYYREIGAFNIRRRKMTFL